MHMNAFPMKNRAARDRKAFYRLALLAFFLCSLSSRAQNQSYQIWPEIDTYVSVNSSVRLSFFASTTKENRQGTDAEVGPNIDFFLKPLLKLKHVAFPSRERNRSVTA